MIYAVDFDGTLCEDKWPLIGQPIMPVIKYLRKARERGHRVILWTMREKEMLTKAVNWCKLHGLEFDAVNDNLPDMIEKYGNNPRKVFADCYLDDRNAQCMIGRKLPKM